MTRSVPRSAYRILGVTPKDDFATIKRAWRKLVKANHPDVVGGDPAVATARLTEINDAYDALRWHQRETERAADTLREAMHAKQQAAAAQQADRMRRAAAAEAARRAAQARQQAEAKRMAEAERRAEAERLEKQREAEQLAALQAARRAEATRRAQAGLRHPVTAADRFGAARRMFEATPQAQPRRAVSA